MNPQTIKKIAETLGCEINTDASATYAFFPDESMSREFDLNSAEVQGLMIDHLLDNYWTIRKVEKRYIFRNTGDTSVRGKSRKDCVIDAMIKEIMR